MKLAFKIGGHNTFENTESARNGGKDKNRNSRKHAQDFISPAKLLNGTCQIVLFQLISQTRTQGSVAAATHTDCVYYLLRAHDPRNFVAELSLPFRPISQR